MIELTLSPLNPLPVDYEALAEQHRAGTISEQDYRLLYDRVQNYASLLNYISQGGSEYSLTFDGDFIRYSVFYEYRDRGFTLDNPVHISLLNKDREDVRRIKHIMDALAREKEAEAKLCTAQREVRELSRDELYHEAVELYGLIHD